ncbi:MAG: creatininase family protein, partial [Candidatus Hadarchaeales archaeon]
EDTDAKLASHVALQAALRTGAKFLGVIYSSHELPLIQTGVHQPASLVLREIRRRVKEARELLGVKGVVVVNGHGGNQPLAKKLAGRKVAGVRMEWDSTLVKGAHAGTEEFSMACALGISDPSKLPEHSDFQKHPEVGFVGLERVLRKYKWAAGLAEETKRGIRAEPELGSRLLRAAVESVCEKIRLLANS